MSTYQIRLSGSGWCPKCRRTVSYTFLVFEDGVIYPPCERCEWRENQERLRGALTLAEPDELQGALGVWRPVKGALTAQGES